MVRSISNNNDVSLMTNTRGKTDNNYQFSARDTFLFYLLR
jgi:hypothetical protein